MTNKNGMQQLTASDGHRLDCHITRATATRRGGLVILQEIFGVTDQLKSVAAAYAADGYDVAVPALFDRVQPGTVVPFDKGGDGRALMLKVAPADTLLDITAAEAVRDGGRVAVIGFCWGGGLALRTAQSLDIAGAVAFYGTRMEALLDTPLRTEMQFHFGATDDHSPPNVIAAVQAAWPQADCHIYNTGHAFANDARPAVYNKAAADTAHARTRAFLRRVIT
ncbi:MAG: dienelactone hydrolase family protein [Rhodospirillales bacterium]